MARLKKHSAYLIYGTIGALSGWFYWSFIGCVDNDCAVASSAVFSTVYGLGIGLFATDSIKELFGRVKFK